MNTPFLLFVALVVLVVAVPIDGPEYTKLSAKEKEAALWDAITSSEYSEFPNDWYGALDELKLFTENMNEPFDRFSDALPVGRKRLIHTFGSIATVKFVANPDSPYSGLFKGADHGIVRMSLAKKPGDSYAPGLGLKLLRDGTYSGNFIAMYELDGQTSPNFFQNQFKTWVSNPSGALKALLVAFKKGAEDPVHLSVDGVAVASANGTEEATVSYPKQVYFVPDGSWEGYNDTNDGDFRAQLAAFPAGGRLYRMMGTKSDCKCYSNSDGEQPCHGNECNDDDTIPCTKISSCADPVELGELFTTSRFVASEFGDRQVFFQHYRYVNKERNTCTYGQPLADSAETRLSGDLTSSCVASSSCPNLVGNDAPVKTPGCPFHFD